jgi:hypothetical protein
LRVQSQEDLKRYTPEFRDGATAKVKDLIEEFVITWLERNPGDVVGLRQQLLDMQEVPFDPETTGTPYVLVANVNGFSGYVVAYLVMRGGVGSPDTKTLLQAYAAYGGKYRLVDETGGDFDGYGFLLTPLGVSDGGLFFLAHGQCANTSWRTRIYAFDGKRFRTLWDPPDRFNLSIGVKGRDLTLTYQDAYHSRYFREDTVRVSGAGVTTLSSRPVGEPR